MSVFDELFTGFQTAATSVATAIAGALGAWLAFRKRVSTDSADIRRTNLEMGWLERLVKERDEQDERIESLRESQLNDARQIARLETEAKACRERMDEAKVECDLAAEEMQLHKSRAIAAEARVLFLTDANTDLRFANGKLFKELAILSPDVAERLMEAHLRPTAVAKPEEKP